MTAAPTAPPWLPIGPGTPLWAEPTTPKPPLRWTRALPGLVLALILITGLAVIATAVTPTRPFGELLPKDGAVSSALIQTSPGQVQQAIVQPAGLASAGQGGRQVAEALEPKAASSTQYLRATFGPSPTGVDQVWLAAEASRLRFDLVSSRDLSFALVPGITVAQRRGQPAVEQSGTILLADPDSVEGPTEAGFRATVTVTTESDDCRTASLSIIVDGLNDPIPVALTLCPGRGLTDFDVQTPGHRLTVDATPNHAMVGSYSGATPISTRPWANWKMWRPQILQPYAIDAFGRTLIQRDLQARPTVRADGTLITVSAATSDLEAYRRTERGLELIWRAHPGGSVVSVTAVGDLVVAATSSGRLVAYERDGLLVWQTDAVTESIAGELLPLTGAVALATLDGTVRRIDARLGEVQWTRRTASSINRGVVGDDRVIQAIDTTGGVYGWAPSGRQVFNGQVAGPSDAIAIDQVNTYLLRGVTLEAYELQHSTFRWGVPTGGRPNGLCPTASGPVVVMDQATNGIDRSSGQVAWRGPGGQELHCGAAAVVIVDERAVEVRSADGRVGASLPTPEPVGVGRLSSIATAPDGVYVVLNHTTIWLGA